MTCRVVLVTSLSAFYRKKSDQKDKHIVKTDENQQTKAYDKRLAAAA